MRTAMAVARRSGSGEAWLAFSAERPDAAPAKSTRVQFYHRLCNGPWPRILSGLGDEEILDRLRAFHARRAAQGDPGLPLARSCLPAPWLVQCALDQR